MKKIKGFTLIELLAVILILGIIALIAIPTVANIIQQSKKSAFETTVNNVVSSAEAACELENLKGQVLTSLYTFANGVVSPELDIKGKLPKSGSALVDSNCNISAILSNGTFLATKVSTSDVVAITEGSITYSVYTNGTAIYFNPITSLKCSLSDYAANTSASLTGNKLGCMKWYAFNDIGNTSNTINMILDHNTTASVAWNSSGINTSGMNQLATTLANDTSSWKSGLSKRLITAPEIASIVGYSSWLTSGNKFYVDSKSSTALTTCKLGNTTGCNYGWLYDRTGSNCKNYGCSNNASATTWGFWTSSPRIGDTTTAWGLYWNGDVNNDAVATSNSGGVRPVITVLKSTFE